MKKLFYFAAAAMMMAACTSEELNVQDQQKLAEDNSAVNFDVYTLRGVTRAGTPGDITDGNIKEGAHQADGFGVFAFYTNEKEYDQSSTPNFMYNQKVVWNGSKWAYEPVKYWPNEFGNAAISDNIDYVTFFAYAPWTQFEPTTGKPVIKTGADVTETAEHQQNFNIFEIKSNKVSGDPIIKYRVDTDPATSVDLLWGVNADPTTWAPIQASSATVTKNEAGYPFLNLLKPSDPVNGKIKFNLRHALAKVKITIDYVADQQTPAVDAAPDDFKSDSIDMAKTRIFVRSLEMDGFALEGALNLNNDVKDHPLWTDLNGKELNFSPVVFNDGRSDGKEGTDGGTKKEENAYLNPEIVENFANTTTRNDTIIFNGGYAGVANGQKNPGVRMHGSDITQLLFGGDPGTNNGYFYVIPRDTENQKVNVKIKYGVLTLDSNLPGKLSGSTDFGSDIENIIEKTDIFNGLDFKAGYQYQINIHLGMTSVKIDAQVEPWDKGSDPTNVNLPDNQPADDSGSADEPDPASNTNAIEVGTVFHFSSQWDADASAKITAINPDGIVTVSVKGSGADGTYFVNLADFGNNVQDGATADDPKKLTADTEVPVYQTADDAANQTNALFNVNIKKNTEDTPTPDPTPAPSQPATIAEAVAANVTAFTYTLVNSSDPAGAEGTLSLTETTEYANTTTPSLTGTYYKFTRATGYYVWIKSDAPIDGTTENRVLGQGGALSDGWRLILQPKE